MNITTFNPQILAKDAAPVVELFEKLGFEKHHDQKEIGTLNTRGIRMKDKDGFCLDISQPDIDLPRDMVGIRMNVDDFEEAYKILEEHGFRNVYGDESVNTKTSRSAMMISPSGFGFNLVQHIK